MIRISLAGIGLIVGACLQNGCQCGCEDSRTEKRAPAAATTSNTSLYARLGGEPPQFARKLGGLGQRLKASGEDLAQQDLQSGERLTLPPQQFVAAH